MLILYPRIFLTSILLKSRFDISPTLFIKEGSRSVTLKYPSTQASQKIFICCGVHKALAFELFWDSLGLGFKVSLVLLIYKNKKNNNIVALCNVLILIC
jgi:hypothetical protein